VLSIILLKSRVLRARSRALVGDPTNLASCHIAHTEPGIEVCDVTHNVITLKMERKKIEFIEVSVY